MVIFFKNKIIKKLSNLTIFITVIGTLTIYVIENFKITAKHRRLEYQNFGLIIYFILLRGKL